MSVEFKIEHVSAGDVRMEVLCFGRGERTLAIIPGLSLGSVLRGAEGVVKAYECFAEDYKVYLFDRRLNMPESYSVAQMAKDTAAVMMEMGLKDIDLFGVSQGGMISQLIAIEHPELIHKLILASTISRPTEKTGDAGRIWLEGTESPEGAAGLYRSFANLVYSEVFLSKYGQYLDAAASVVTEEDMHRFKIQLQGIGDFSTYDDLERIKCPVLVMGAWKDKVTGPDASIEIARRLSCQLVMYPSPYGHAVYDEAPDFKQRILKFLSE